MRKENYIQCVARVDRYDDAQLLSAIERHFAALDVESLLRPGIRVLIKPNLITARRPDSGAVTHPSVVRAAARWLLSRGVKSITIADSPGGPHAAANLLAVYAASGYSALNDIAELNTDTAWSTVDAAEGSSVKTFNIIRPALDCDLMIDVCKLKTHGMMGMTAGVKNLFGLIPGLQKPEMHFRLPRYAQFADMLIDLARTVTPQVVLVDAIDAMEGNGPSSGTIRHMGLLLAARDVFSQDDYACRLMGFDPEKLVFTRRLRERGLVAEPTLVGDVALPADPPFLAPDSMKLDFSGALRGWLGKPFSYLAGALLRPYPFIDERKCVGCGKCLESCPPQMIRMVNKKARIDRRGCISCFCCQEMCPAHAVDARRRLRR